MRVRKVESDVADVADERKGDFEGEREVVFVRSTFPALEIRVAVVDNVVADATPTWTAHHGLFHGIHDRLHAVTELTQSLLHVDDVESTKERDANERMHGITLLVTLASSHSTFYQPRSATCTAPSR